MSKKRIAIFQTDLRVGGIQKVLVNMLNNLDLSEYEIDLYLFDDRHFFELEKNDNVNVIQLERYHRFNKFVFFDFIRFIKNSISIEKEYDIAIDFNGYSNECAVNTLGVKAKRRIMWIHSDLETRKEVDFKYRILYFFQKSKFKYYDEFVAVSEGIVESFKNASGVRDKKITVISNYIDTKEIFEKSNEVIDFKPRDDCYNLISVGRLGYLKGFDLQLDCMREIVKGRKDVHLYIIGNGPDREKLEDRCIREGLADFVTFLGNKSNPYPYLAKADGFLFTSRCEGRALAILEAKALGLELYITKNLEKYYVDIKAPHDIAKAVIGAKKKEKIKDSLFENNKTVEERFAELLADECK